MLFTLLQLTFLFFFCSDSTIQAAEQKQKPFPAMQSTVYQLLLDGINCLVIKPCVSLKELEIAVGPHTSAPKDSLFLTVTARTSPVRKDDSKESPEILRIPLKKALRIPHETHEIEITATRDPDNARRILLSVSGHK